MADYPLNANARAAERKRRADQIMAGARVAAQRVGRSLKCRGQTLLSPASELHVGEPGGCRNDGSTCLCECHDPKPAGIDG